MMELSQISRGYQAGTLLEPTFFFNTVPGNLVTTNDFQTSPVRFHTALDR